MAIISKCHRPDSRCVFGKLQLVICHFNVQLLLYKFLISRSFVTKCKHTRTRQALFWREDYNYIVIDYSYIIIVVFRLKLIRQQASLLTWGLKIELYIGINPV